MEWVVIVIVATPGREVVALRDIGVGQSTAVAATATAAAAGGGAATPSGTTAVTDPGTRTVVSMLQALEVSKLRVCFNTPIFIVLN